jgi:uncharacterized protein YkwD
VPARRALLACLAAALACDAAAAPEPTEESILPETDVCDPVRDWDDADAALEHDLQAALNALRAEGGRCGALVFPPAPAVYMDPALRCQARLHSQDMVAREYLGEVDPDGLGTAARLAGVGYEPATFAENVGFGYADAATALQLWADSPANCWKLYARELTELGVGVVAGAFTPKDEEAPIDGRYWTVTLAAR